MGQSMRLLLTLFCCVCSLLSIARADSIQLDGGALYSVNLAAPPSNSSLGGVALGDSFNVALTFAGSLTGAGSYAITRTVFNDITAGVTESNFLPGTLVITASGPQYFFSVHSCLDGPVCALGNQLDLNFIIQATQLTGSETVLSVFGLKDAELFEDDGETDFIGSLNGYSYVPEPGTLALFGVSSLFLVVGRSRKSMLHRLKEIPMKKVSCVAVLVLSVLFVAAPSVFAVDGVALITQATANYALPGCTGQSGFPIKICQPGSYRLASNIVLSARDVVAIHIQSDNVTLDLNGFTLFGPGTSVHNGVGVLSSSSNTTISNGKFSAFEIGLSLLGNTATVEGVTLTGNQLAVYLLGDGVRLDRLTIRNNGAGGVYSISFGAVSITNSIVTSNGFYGLYFDANGTHVYGGNILTFNPQGDVIGNGTSLGNNVCTNNIKC